MRRYGWLLLAAVFAISGGVGYVYYQAKLLQAKNAPAPPIQMQRNTSGQANDWCWSQSVVKRIIVEVCAKEFSQLENPPRIDLKKVVLKIYHKDGGKYDLVECEHAELRMKDNILYADSEVDMTLGMKGDNTKPDDAPPKGRILKIKSSGVSFDMKTQKAATDRATEFSFDRGYGRAVGAIYDPTIHQIILQHQGKLHWNAKGPTGKAMDVETEEVTYDEATEKVYLKPWSKLTRDTLLLNAGEAVVTLENGDLRLVDAKMANGVDKMPKRQLEYSADALQMIFGEKNLIERITGTNNAKLAAIAATGRTDVTTKHIDLHFKVEEKESLLVNAMAEGNTVVLSRPAASGANHAPNRTLKSDVVELQMRDGGEEIAKVLTHSPAEIEFIPNKPTDRYRRMNGERITMNYGEKNQLETFRSNKVTTFTKGEQQKGKPPAVDIVTSSGELLAKFDPKSGQMQTLEQWVSFRYKEGTREARANKARMEQTEGVVYLDEAANVWDPTGATTADKITMDQKTGDMVAEGNVTSTRQPEAKAKPGSLLEPGEPTQARAKKMTTRDKREKVTYEGDAVLWQSTNRIEAQRIDIDRKLQKLDAVGNVTSQFLDKPKEGKKPKNPAPIYTVIKAPEMTYSDVDRLAIYKNSVVLDRPDMNVKSTELRAWLKKTEKETSLDHAIADGAVKIFQTDADRTRTSTGEHAVYEVAEEKVTIEGGKPMLVDSLRGTTKGQKLTWFSNDDRLIVDGVLTERVVTTIKRKDKKK